MNEQELNKKLAGWVGLEFINYYQWLYPDGSYHKQPPNFPQSLDTCFKWLVPLAVDKIMAKQECSSDVAYAILFKKWLQELELIIPEAALALCLAIAKMIGQGEANA